MTKEQNPFEVPGNEELWSFEISDYLEILGTNKSFEVPRYDVTIPKKYDAAGNEIPRNILCTMRLMVDDWGKITCVEDNGNEKFRVDLSLESNPLEADANGGHSVWEQSAIKNLTAGSYFFVFEHQNIQLDPESSNRAVFIYGINMQEIDPNAAENNK